MRVIRDNKRLSKRNLDSSEMNIMKCLVEIDNIILTCDIHSYIKKSPDFNSWESDVDYYGYEEIEFTVESALELDEDGIPYDLSSTEIDKLMGDEWFVKFVEKELIKTIKVRRRVKNE